MGRKRYVDIIIKILSNTCKQLLLEQKTPSLALVVLFFVIFIENILFRI